MGGKLIAFQIYVAAPGLLNGFIMAFDSRYGKYAPSRILTFESFRHELETFQTRRIETGWGPVADPFKSDFSSGRQALHDLRVDNGSLRTRVVVRLVNAILAIRKRCGAVDRLAQGMKCGCK